MHPKQVLQVEGTRGGKNALQLLLERVEFLLVVLGGQQVGIVGGQVVVSHAVFQQQVGPPAADDGQSAAALRDALEQELPTGLGGKVGIPLAERSVASGNQAAGQTSLYPKQVLHQGSGVQMGHDVLCKGGQESQNSRHAAPVLQVLGQPLAGRQSLQRQSLRQVRPDKLGQQGGRDDDAVFRSRQFFS